MRISRRPPAFTLVELLVVIAIIGILVALLLPAINAARETARRLQCANHQRQFALALLNFESSNGALPVAGLTAATAEYAQRSGPQFGWMVLVLPFLEEQSLFDRFDFSPGMTAFTQQGDPQRSEVSINHCPSDGARGRLFEARGKSLAKGNYVAYVSPQHVADLRYLPGALGGFKPRSADFAGQRLRNIKDGVSRTLAIAEVRTLDHVKDQRGTWALSWGACSVICPDVHHDSDYPFDIYVPNPVDNGRINLHRPNSTNPDELVTCLGEVRHQAELANMPCIPMRNEILINGAARSLHPGGVVASALDGHTGFLSEEIDPEVYGRLVSVYDGAPLDVTDHLR